MRRAHPAPARTAARRLLLAVALIATGDASAVVYPARDFGADEGLVTDNAATMLHGSRGQVWLATSEGLARLDGDRFRVLGEESGLHSPAATDVVEAVDGALWLATTAGLCRLDPERHDDRPAFECGALEHAVEGLALSADGTALWATTPAGFFRVPLTASPPRLEPVEPNLSFGCRATRSRPQADPTGGVWFGTSCGLARLDAGGAIDEWHAGPTRPRGWPLHVDGTGAVWFVVDGDDDGLLGFRPPAATSPTRIHTPASLRAGPHLPGVGETVRVPLPAPHLRGPTAHAVSRRGGAEIWVGTTRGAARIREGSVETVTPDARHRPVALWVLGVGRDGTVWTAGSGRVRALHPAGFTSFADDEGPGTDAVIDLFEDADGLWIVSIEPPDRWRVHRRVGERFDSVVVGLPATATRTWWGFNHRALRDRRGGWWFATLGGLVHHPPASRPGDLADATRAVLFPNASFGVENGVWTVFEDSRGTLWVSAWPSELFRWEAGAARPERIAEFSALESGAVCSYAEDHDGAIWFGTYEGALVRWRDGDLTTVPVEPADTPARMITDLFVDAAGRVLVAHPWAGALVVPDPGAARPTTVALDDPPLRRVQSVIEDRDGVLWFGTLRGVYRVRPGDPEPRRFSGVDGLPSAWTQSLHVDAVGRLWVGTGLGLATLVPDDRENAGAALAPSVLAALVDGARIPLPWLGTRDLDLPRLPAGLHHLELTLSGERTFGSALQYRVRQSAGADDVAWSAPIDGARLRLAGLGVGEYVVEVRATDRDGGRASLPARVGIRVAPYWWRTSWAVGLSLAAVLAGVVVVHRLRLRRFVQRDRIRRRIAGDLHDELGTSLARISILSGVADASRSREDVAPLVRAIGETARAAVDANSDMVWAIDPRRDRSDEIVRRLRAFASGLVESVGARLIFEETLSRANLTLGPDVRRNVYLCVKEAIANAVKHAEPREVRVRLDVAGSELIVVVEDDGVGFDPDDRDGASDDVVPLGYGLHSIERRVRELGGRLLVESRPGHGTRLSISVPLAAAGVVARGRAWLRNRFGRSEGKG